MSDVPDGSLSHQLSVQWYSTLLHSLGQVGCSISYFVHDPQTLVSGQAQLAGHVGVTVGAGVHTPFFKDSPLAQQLSLLSGPSYSHL